MNKVVVGDFAYVFDRFEEKEKLYKSTILITGCAGFLGFYLLNFLLYYAEELQIKLIIGLDNFVFGKPQWIIDLIDEHKNKLYILDFDIAKDDIASIKNNVETADYIIHMASIASPTFYRQYPIETIDGNIWGLRNLLDYYKDKAIRGFCFSQAVKSMETLFLSLYPSAKIIEGMSPQ